MIISASGIFVGHEKCWGCPTSIVKKVGGRFINVRESLIFWTSFWDRRGPRPPNTGIRAQFTNKSEPNSHTEPETRCVRRRLLGLSHNRLWKELAVILWASCGRDWWSIYKWIELVFGMRDSFCNKRGSRPPNNELAFKIRETQDYPTRRDVQNSLLEA